MQRLIDSLPFVLALASTPLVGCADSESGDDAPTSPNADRYAEALATIDFGAQVTVIEPDGTTWSGAAGNAAVNEPMNTDHVLLLGSATKMLTTTIVLQLVDEGALALDDTAAQWVPQLRDDITVRMLLQHESGMGEYFDSDAMTRDGRAGVSESWTPAELIALGQEVGDIGPTNEVFYSNTNFIALGLVIEAITQRTYEAVLDERIFAPLELESAGLMMGGDAFPDTLAYGESGALGVVTHEHPSVGWAAGSAYMSSDDLARFLVAASHGELYSDELLAQQLVPGEWKGDDSPGVDASYGLGLQMYDIAGTRFDGHLGHVDGFAAAALLDESTGTTVVALTNQQDNAVAAFLALDVLGYDVGM
ncbi:MAG TPA: serine hydrolase domain-containing protein [Nannocystaceae bacterium]|nr:serine hydrolase domain-containing protein [Nannocystaceae bacterium]